MSINLQTHHHKVLVVGATGNTGKYVVRQLLDLGHTVSVIVRSKERMFEVLPPPQLSTNNNNQDSITGSEKDDRLVITEASLLDLSDTELDEHICQVDTIICCLGHTLSYDGIFGHPRRLVTDATKCIVNSIHRVSSNNDTTTTENKDNNMQQSNKRRFILMSSDGVTHPTDKPRGYIERFLFALIRYLPPHIDNEEAANYLLNTCSSTNTLEWVVVRPSKLQNGPVSTYQLHHNPMGNSVLFENHITTRATVAKYMVDLTINTTTLWNKWKFLFPVIYDDATIQQQQQQQQSYSPLDNTKEKSQ